ncbi:MAG TPA: ATP-dependent zinc metalloprotease FtsH [Acidimicrobiales bacterium]|nr:ATP-dependent zinc metalloprotease FtsH [Acidimicrobiales bacterium]
MSASPSWSTRPGGPAGAQGRTSQPGRIAAGAPRRPGPSTLPGRAAEADDRAVSPSLPPPPAGRPAGAPTGPGLRRGWVWVAVSVALVLGFFALVPSPSTSDELDYATFRARVVAGRVESVEIHQDSGKIEGTLTSGDAFTTQGPPGGIPDADVELLDEHEVERNYAAASSDWFGQLLLYLLPFLLIVGVLVWMSRRASSQLTGASAFTRSRARIHRAERTSTTFADVAGYDAVKAEISEVVDFLKDPTRFAEIGARIPKGILLVGPPGTGKTLVAKAVAGEAGVPFISITGSEFLEMFVGVGAARVRDLFATARKETPSILFVDEIDAIGRKRGTGLGGGHDEREQTLNQLLAEMDGFEPTEGIVVLAATNRPDILDAALLRAGRFDRQVVIPLPTAVERRAILEVHARGKRLGPDVDLDLLARGTPGMSGADLANLLNEAALIAVRRRSTVIGRLDVDAARDRVLLGVPRGSLALSAEEKRTVAYHEAGHALLASVLPGADPVHKVSILPAGVALGATQQVPVAERQLRRQGELADALAIRLAGRAAEELVFGDVSTGAADDLASATELARRMVREWGMSPRLGEMAWGTQGPVFLGEDLVHTRDYSDETARVIDEEVARILGEQGVRARAELERHEAALHALAGELLEHETLEADDIARILAGPGPLAAAG